METSFVAARPYRELRRSHDRRIGGVCAGVAEYFGVDPNLVRLAFVAGAVIGGGAILVYAAAWVLVPEATDPSAVATPADRPAESPGGSHSGRGAGPESAPVTAA